MLRSPEYCDLAPAQVWAKLLDDGIYLCSIRTMYRLLAIAGENRERRRQRTHPANKKPELCATKPNEVWSWDITKLRGPERGVNYELFVIIDIYSRYVVAWMVTQRETGELAKAFIDDALAAQGIARDQLWLHADRGTSMTSKSVAQLLVDLGVERSHSRPHVSNDNPYSEIELQDTQVLPRVPRPVRVHRRRPQLLRHVLRVLQPRAPPLRHRAAHTRVRALRHRHRNPRTTRRCARRRLRRQPNPLPAPPPRTARAPDRRVDQRPLTRSTHPKRMTNDCLKMLDRFRAASRVSRLAVSDLRRR